jgi:type II secretory pathway component HofQ
LALRSAAALFLVASLAVAASGGGRETEARLSVDVKDAPVASLVGLLVELGGRQAVLDPDVRCSLTLTLHEVPWLTALEATLRACGLGYEESAGVLWVAPTSRLREEADARRRVKETRSPGPGRELALFRLSYARAEEMAPLLDRFVAPRGEVTVDSRTNTLIVRY